MDETPWVESRESAWLWVATTHEAALYLIAPERSAAIVRQILGEEFSGIVGSDRAKAYLIIDPEKRQLCWFHLGRNFQSKIELGGEDAVFGRQMRAFESRLWRAQHLLEAGKIDRASYDRRMKMLRGEVQRAIEGWAATAPDPTVGVGAMCHNLVELEPALWNFVEHPGVCPTNNRAERDIRMPVIWRRSSFGTDSQRGSRFVERILTVVATCRKQARSSFRFLADFLSSVWGPHPQHPPRLLPDSS
jgi:transposase